MLAGDGDDEFSLSGPMAFNVDLGPGDDSLTPGALPDADVEPTAVTVTGGDGNDVIEVDARSATLSGEAGDDHLRGGQVTAGGPWTMDGGDGDDTLLNSGARDLRMLGGAGDDRLITSMDDIATAIDCGPGADEVQPGFEDRPGAGCAPHLTELSGRRARPHRRDRARLRGGHGQDHGPDATRASGSPPERGGCAAPVGCASRCVRSALRGAPTSW